MLFREMVDYYCKKNNTKRMNRASGQNWYQERPAYSDHYYVKSMEVCFLYAPAVLSFKSKLRSSRI